jgi:N-acetylneuraminic acid mutarotase
MVVWGGREYGAALDTGGRYDPATNTWTATSTAGTLSGRDNPTSVWTGTDMIVWGGWVHDNNTGSRYRPSTNSWTPTSTGGPSGRYEHTAIWTGAEMIVWGGSAGPLTNTGGRYFPSTDTWAATSTIGAPQARREHVAAWTGTEMIVWGGNIGGAGIASGGRYNPTTDSWAPTSTEAAPAARYGHHSVWTGSEMIVWGGWDGLTNHASGGRYTPSTDTWTGMSTAGPSNHYATAVWSGTEMILWAGQGTSDGRYDPSTDTWAPISGVGAPSPRSTHTAVWAGDEMIVWGGFATSTYAALNTGGRYDPSSDSWTPTSTASAPGGRHGHTAVWTGNEMIVWGGRANGSFDTGGRYVPSTDTWYPTSTLGAPVQRDEHTAVWTGTEMIVWGGPSYANPWRGHLSSGGRYEPPNDGASCDDGSACTTDDRCVSAACTGTLVVPGQTAIHAETKARFVWSEVAGADPVRYDAVRGVLGFWPLPGQPGHVCVWSEASDPEFTDHSTPYTPDGYWYLVRARDGCGAGSYGTLSNGTPRYSGACP